MYGDASQLVPLGAEAVNATASLIAFSCEYTIQNITCCSYTYTRVSTHICTTYTNFNRVHIRRCVPDGPLGRRGHERHRAPGRFQLRIYDSERSYTYTRVSTHVYASFDACIDSIHGDAENRTSKICFRAPRGKQDPNVFPAPHGKQDPQNVFPRSAPKMGPPKMFPCSARKTPPLQFFTAILRGPQNSDKR